MTDDAQNQRLRLRRLGLSVITYVIWAAFLLYGDALGVFALEIAGTKLQIWWMIGAMAASLVVFVLLFVTGANRRFNDPSLTMAMMLNALTWAVLTAGAAPEHRAFSFTAFIVIFVFGIFGLRAAQYAVCLVYSIVGYAAIVYFTLPDPMETSRINLEVMQALLLFAMLFWIAFFGNYVGRLRARLADRNAELKRAFELVEELSIRDELTGVHNRRHVMEALAVEHQRANRHGVPFSVMVLDLDRFKEVNDTHGHGVGDEVLKRFVARLADAVRGVDLVGASTERKETDTIGRFGGEEFIVLLPHTQLAGAKRVGERVLKEVSSKPFETSAGEIAVTASIGVTEYEQGEPLHKLLERADSAMYAAKRSGRDRLAAAPADADATPVVYRPSDS